MAQAWDGLVEGKRTPALSLYQSAWQGALINFSWFAGLAVPEFPTETSARRWRTGLPGLLVADWSETLAGHV